MPRPIVELINEYYYSRQLGIPDVARETGLSANVLYKFMRKHKLPRRALTEVNALHFARKPLSFHPKPALTKEEE